MLFFIYYWHGHIWTVTIIIILYTFQKLIIYSRKQDTLPVYMSLLTTSRQITALECPSMFFKYSQIPVLAYRKSRDPDLVKIPGPWNFFRAWIRCKYVESILTPASHNPFPCNQTEIKRKNFIMPPTAVHNSKLSSFKLSSLIYRSKFVFFRLSKIFFECEFLCAIF